MTGLQVIGEATDGLEAVQKAKELQPDLILLDLGLPTLNGIEAACQILETSPTCKILFVSEDRSWEIAKEALRSGAVGYVIKAYAADELLPAVKLALQGKKFMSLRFAARNFPDFESPQHAKEFDKTDASASSENVDVARHHEAGIYSDDLRLLDGATTFLASYLNAGSAAIVVATESHRKALVPRLVEAGVDIGAAIEQGRYIVFDAADTLSKIMLKGVLDEARFMLAFGELILTPAKSAQGQHPRVAVFGECVRLLCAEGNAEAAIKMEKLGNSLANKYEVDILCGYSSDIAHGDLYERICAEHAVVHSC